MSETSVRPDPIRALREGLIKVIFWSLGLAAALAVLAVLTGNTDVGLRASGTALLTAGAAAVLWSIGSINQRHGRARTVGLVCTLVTYVCLLLPLWGAGLAERWLGSAVFTGSAGVVCLVTLILSASATTRWTGIVGTVSCGLLWLTAMIGVWTDSLWAYGGDAAETWSAFAVSFLLAAVCLLGVRPAPGDWWRWVGVGAAALAFPVVVALIWDIAAFPQELFAATITIAVVVAHANLVLMARLDDRFRWLQVGTIAAAIVTGCGIDLLLLQDSPGGILGRITAAASILSGVGTLAVIVLTLYLRPRSAPPPQRHRDAAEITTMDITCPICGFRQSVSLNGDRCAGCQVEIDIRIAMPRVLSNTELAGAETDRSA